MTNEDLTPDNQPPREGGIPIDRRPLGAWLRIVDALITREFETALADEGASRRDWMVLNALAGTVDAPELIERLQRRGKRLRALAERGWVAETDGRWELTDEGRAAHARLGGLVQRVREKVAGAVSPEEFATTMASLEAIARALGWDESQRMPRPGRRRFGPRRGFGFGGDFGPRGGFGPGSEFGSGHEFGPGSEFGPGRDFGHGRHGFGPHGYGRHGYGPRATDAVDPGDDAHAHPREHCGRGPRAHGHERHGHERHGHERVGHEHDTHERHGHGHDGHGHRGHRHAERAFERGFAAGFRAARSHGAADAASGSAA